MDSILEFADILGLLMRELSTRYHFALIFVSKDWYNAVVQRHLTDPNVIPNYIPIFPWYEKTKMRAICPSLGLLRHLYFWHRANNGGAWTDEEREWYYYSLF